MRFGSVCSGIESASVAWSPLGWEADWFAEVDRAASEVLAHRFPDVPNHGDMTKLAGMVRRREISAPDILVGGTPCQSFSIAGLRGGLSDARGQLTLAFVDLANAIDEIRIADGNQPCIVVWENVPGILSHADNPLGCFIGALAGDDDPIEPGPRPESGRSAAYWTWDKKSGEHRPKWPDAGCAAGPQRAIAWRTLDAQWFLLAQRRRRVFVVASARQGFDPASILLEFDGVRRDSAPSREAGEKSAGTLASRTTGGGFPGTDEACSGYVPPVVRGHAGVVCPTLRAGGNTTGGDRPPGTDVDTADSLIVTRAPLTMAHGQGGAEIQENLCSTLTCNHEAPIAFTAKDFGGDASVNLSPTLRSMGHSSSHANGGGQVGVAYSVALRGREGGATAELGDDVAGCLRASGGGGDKPHVLTYAIQERAVSENPNHGPSGKGWSDEGVTHTLEARHHVQAVCVTGSICDVEGCNVKRHANGFCRAHYGRFKRYGDPLAGRTPEGEALDFLKAALIADLDDCIIWPYAKLQTGYGSIEYEGKTQRAHRVVCRMAHGEPAQAELDAAHSCGVRHCVNPNHLRWASRGENMQDAIDHGTTTRGEGHALHKLSEEDVLQIFSRLAQGETHQSIADDFGVSRNAITDINKGKNWAWLRDSHQPTMAVRRLMPVECERLQGFPDNWTLVLNAKGKLAADGPRYKQLGNSMATHVMNWIGRRIQQHLNGIGHNGGPPLDDFESCLS